MKILVLDGFALNPGDLSWKGIKELGTTVVYDRTEQARILNRIGDAEIVLVNKCPITRETIEACPNLKLICVTATGYNTVDVQAAKEKGILVCNVPTYATEAVTQHVFAMLFAITNRVYEHAQSVRAGDWQHAPDFSYRKTPLDEIAGQTMGIIGAGRIGMSVARVAKAFGMKVLCYKGNNPHPEWEDEQLRFVSFDELLANSDIISLHCPLTAETENMIRRETIAKMKKGVIIINTARGKIINDTDLANALSSGRVGYAAIDVLAEEPPVHGSPLIEQPHCMVTPHIAWAPLQARRRCMQIVEDNIRAFQQGKPQNVVAG